MGQTWPKDIQLISSATFIENVKDCMAYAPKKTIIVCAEDPEVSLDDSVLRKYLREQNSATFIENFADSTTYVPTRTIIVCSEYLKIPFANEYLWAEFRKLDIEKSITHMEPTDERGARWEVTFASEEETERSFQRLQAASDAHETELKPYNLPRINGIVTVSGLSSSDISKALEYFETYVRNPTAKCVEKEIPSEGIQEFVEIHHEGIKRTITTNIDLGIYPPPEVVATTHQSKHIVDTVEQVETLCQNRFCIMCGFALSRELSECEMVYIVK